MASLIAPIFGAIVTLRLSSVLWSMLRGVSDL